MSSEELEFSPLDANPTNEEISPQINAELPKENQSKPSYFSLEFYKQFFNVSTLDIIHRLKMSINFKDNNFLIAAVPPDLYGPIWIPFTLAFFTMICGSISVHVSGIPHSDLSSFMTNLTTLFLFTFGIPFLWKYLTRSLSTPSVVTTISLFGYSLSLLFPIPFVCLIFGNKLSFYISFLLSLGVGFFFFTKLTNSFSELNDRNKAFLPNLIASCSFALTAILIIRNAFR